MLLYREPLHRRTVLKALLLITMISGVLFCILNTQRGVYALATIELLTAAYSLLLYRVVSRTRHLDAWILAYLLPFLSIMMFALAQPGTSDSIFVWVFLIPQISYLLTGVKRGFMITGFYLLTAAALFYNRYQDMETMPAVSIANTVICAIAIWSFAHYYEQSRERYSRRLLQIAERDSLTGLLNRMRLAEVVDSEIRNAETRGQTMAMILLDLDHFKQVNDCHGHPAGDHALIYVAEKLQSAVRKTDYVFRLGGEEFCILLPGADRYSAAEVAESARRELEQGDFCMAGKPLSLTASFGIAVSGEDGHELVELYHIADQRMYAAKHGGRNRVIADDLEELHATAFAVADEASELKY